MAKLSAETVAIILSLDLHDFLHCVLLEPLDHHNQPEYNTINLLYILNTDVYVVTPQPAPKLNSKRSQADKYGL